MVPSFFVGVWIPQLNIIQILLLSQRYLQILKEPSKSEQNCKDMLLLKARKTPNETKRNQLYILKKQRRHFEKFLTTLASYLL